MPRTNSLLSPPPQPLSLWKPMRLPTPLVNAAICYYFSRGSGWGTGREREWGRGALRWVQAPLFANHLRPACPSAPGARSSPPVNTKGRSRERVTVHTAMPPCLLRGGAAVDTWRREVHVWRGSDGKEQTWRNRDFFMPPPPVTPSTI